MSPSTRRQRLGALLVAAAVLITAPLAVIATDSFTDVPTSNVHHSNITWLKDAGVTVGCNPAQGNTRFCPDDPVTRAQMATFMRRLAENKVVDAATAITAETAAPTGPAGGALSGTYPNPGLAPNESFRNIGASGQPAFQNGWSNFGGGWSTAGFFKDHQGIVYLKGTITGGASGTTAFTLPEGYRPSQNMFLPVANGVFAYILATGQVQPFYTGGSDIGFDGLSFRTDLGVATAGDSGEAPGS